MSIGTRSRFAIGAAAVVAMVVVASIPATAAFAAPAASGGKATGTPAGTPAGTQTQSQSRPHCTTADLPAARVYVNGLLHNRVVELDKLGTRLGSSQHVTSADRSELQTDISGDIAAMGELAQQVPGDATCGALISTARTMVVAYRVFMVVAPKTDLVIVSDTESAVASEMQSAESRIQAAITSAGANGKDVAQAQEAFANLETEVTGALAAVNGVSANVMAQTPAGSPGNRPVFVSARSSCETAYANLHQAHEDLSLIESVL